MDTETKGLGTTQTEHLDLARLELESGEVIAPVTLAYETYGKLNPDKSNAVVICHALTGDAHIAGVNAKTGMTGWWDSMVGPGKAFDTDHYFVICSNVIGGCQGSTGPLSPNPATREPYGLDFPIITIGDMVAAQAKLVEHLGIERLLSVAGGSMGGMQALSWAVKFPKHVNSIIAIATTAKHSPQQIAFNEVGRQAILSDPHFNDGKYYGGKLPERGLATARMVGHITYMSDESMAEKFGRRFREATSGQKFAADFEVAGYLQYKGDNFVKRFDANSYLYITRAVDLFDLAGDQELPAALTPSRRAPFLVLAFKSDWLYPSYQSRELVRGCKLAGVDVTYCEINSTYGHDAFLLEVAEETHLIRHFLRKVSSGITAKV
ncbi:homoserine O-acetyltransferase [Dehalogenimonas etheniformans]|uniref:Homoserine O-acetyltransferase n=2 Tax=Dehalogenimonas etheniformans TaxID=1536648 RepID=A0A2P5P7Z5_9CHLR|nr:homoserine O-acetyltransferase [Dehalogenimonas etheniformans]PPD58422.1 homoserine O-acetyltransferase [Dehalogenimonas etheniformans]QNT77187.1 homoserine O-acetyltransferase [Dehalogenimonas etheniformans]